MDLKVVVVVGAGKSLPRGCVGGHRVPNRTDRKGRCHFGTVSEVFGGVAVNDSLNVCDHYA